MWNSLVKPAPTSNANKLTYRITNFPANTKVAPNSALLINHNFATFAEKLLIPLISK
jgi:hypothetical protein